MNAAVARGIVLIRNRDEPCFPHGTLNGDESLDQAAAGSIEPETPGEYRAVVDTGRRPGAASYSRLHPGAHWCPHESLTSVAAFHYLVASCSVSPAQSRPRWRV